MCTCLFDFFFLLVFFERESYSGLIIAFQLGAVLKEFQLSSFWCEDLLEGFSHSNTLRSRDQNLWTGGGALLTFITKVDVSSFCLMSWPCGELGPDVVFLSFLFQHDFNINVQASINNCIKKNVFLQFYCSELVHYSWYGAARKKVN